MTGPTKERMDPYDALPPEVRRAITETTWGVSPDDMIYYNQLLKYRKVEDVLELIKTADTIVGERQYMAGRAFPECSTDPKVWKNAEKYRQRKPFEWR